MVPRKHVDLPTDDAYPTVFSDEAAVVGSPIGSRKAEELRDEDSSP
jgi:hypothetical protein